MAIWRAMKDKSRRVSNAKVFYVTWFLLVFIFFSVSRTKLPTYIYPLFPVMALVVGRLWDLFVGKGLRQKAEKYMYISLYSFLVFHIGSLIGITIFLRSEYDGVALPSFITAVIFVALMTAFTLLVSRGKYKEGLVSFIASFLILVYAISYFILPEVGRYESSKEISEKLLTLASPNETIGAETQYRRGVAFYTGRENIPDVHKHHIVIEYLATPKRVWAVLKEKNHIQLYTTGKKPYRYPTYVMYQVGKKVIVTNKKPRDGKYIKVRTPDEPY
jgi:4-amino-4-deoxy-L-arabinose transferase-like glycosyltransferase